MEVAEGDQANDEDVEVEVAEGDQADDKDVEVEVKENVEAVVQEDVELEIDQVEVGTVLLKRTLGVSFQLENNCESLFFLSFLLFFLFRQMNNVQHAIPSKVK